MNASTRDAPPPQRRIVLRGAPSEALLRDVIPDDVAAANGGIFVAQQQLAVLRKKQLLGVQAPQGTPKNVWLLEHMRLLIIELNELVGLLAAACTPASCPVMGTADLQYLCASHPEPRECSAIDYAVHTLDGASALLANQRTFPSRVSVSESAASNFPSLARRLYRVLSHAWRHHPAKFAEFETARHCAVRITAVAREYGLLSADQLLIPDAALDFSGAAGDEVGAAAQPSAAVASSGASGAGGGDNCEISWVPPPIA